MPFRTELIAETHTDCNMATSPAWEPKIIAFICNWCSYVGADLAGTSRLPYPENVRIVRVPCSGRVDPTFVVRSFQRGVDGVLVSGCHPGDCHYNRGNYYAQRRMGMLRKLLEFTGIDPRRLQMSWVSASEGAKWARVVAEVTEEVRRLGPLRPPGLAESLRGPAHEQTLGSNGQGRGASLLDGKTELVGGSQHV